MALSPEQRVAIIRRFAEQLRKCDDLANGRGRANPEIAEKSLNFTAHVMLYEFLGREPTQAELDSVCLR